MQFNFYVTAFVNSPFVWYETTVNVSYKQSLFSPDLLDFDIDFRDHPTASVKHLHQ